MKGFLAAGGLTAAESDSITSLENANRFYSKSRYKVLLPMWQ